MHMFKFITLIFLHFVISSNCLSQAAIAYHGDLHEKYLENEGKKYLEEANYDMNKIRKLLLKDAKKGDVMIQKVLASFYYSEELDDKKAIKWLLIAAKANDIQACEMLGLIYEENSNHVESCVWYHQAIKLGNEKLWTKFHNVVEQLDKNEFLKLAKKEDPLYMFLYAESMYTNDFILSGEVVKWYLKAAEKGHLKSQYTIAQYYHDLNDTEKEEFWYRTFLSNLKSNPDDFYDRMQLNAEEALEKLKTK